MTAVAVWDELPTADTLLQKRLASGWQPTPTDTRDGPKILGHACTIKTMAQGGGEAGR